MSTKIKISKNPISNPISSPNSNSNSNNSNSNNKPKRPKATEEQKEYLANTIKPLFDRIYELKDDTNGHPISEVFQRLPLRNNTEYYKIIKRPISLHSVGANLKHRRYNVPQHFVLDLAQITWNARFYNEKESSIAKDAMVLDEFLREIIIPALIKDENLFGHEDVTYPSLGPLPGEDGNDDEYTQLQSDGNENDGGALHGNENEGEDDEDEDEEEEDDDDEDEDEDHDDHEDHQDHEVHNHADNANHNDDVNITVNRDHLENNHKGPKYIEHNNNVHNRREQSSGISVAAPQAQPLSSMPQTGQFQIINSTFKTNNNDNNATADSSHNGSYNNNISAPTNIPNSHGTVSTSGTPTPTPTPTVITMDQQPVMVPKPSPIVLNTTTALAPHPNQREILESWNKRGKPPVIDKPHEQRIKNIMRNMKKQRNSKGELLYADLDRLPNIQIKPDYYKKISNPICIDNIRIKTKQRKYPNVESFLNDLFLVIENNKLYYQDTNPEMMQKILEFEQTVKVIISEELAKPDSSYLVSDAHGMRVPIDYLEINDHTYKVGDWILLRNPNDETKPIPAQIFRIWSTPDDGNKRYVNVCWYYRPEQTVHRVDRLFYENEVFKTGQYRDHLVEDIIGPCYVAYFTRYQRGEPAFKFEGPLFICEFRYSDHDKNFNKIRTWKACIPDEVREIEDPIIPFPNGNLRFFQKFTSPLMHLLPPNATERDPIPEPIIASLNAPPLIGGVYKRGPALDDDLGQYLSSPARNVIIKKSTSSHYSSPQPVSHTHQFHQQTQQFQQQQAQPHQLQQQQQAQQQQAQAQAQQQAQQHAQQQAQQAYRQHPQVLQQAHYYGNVNNNISVINNNQYANHQQTQFSTKIVSSPYNQLHHSVSNFIPSTTSNSFLIPYRLQKLINNNRELVQAFTNVLDLKNKDRLLKSSTYIANEFQQSQKDAEAEGSRGTNSPPLPNVWFRGPPVVVNNRIINQEFFNERNSDLLRFGKGRIPRKPKPEIRVDEEEEEERKRIAAKAEFFDGLPPVKRRRRVIKPIEDDNKESVTVEKADEEIQRDEEAEKDTEEEDNNTLDEEVILPGAGVFGFNRFGHSAEYMLFKLKNQAEAAAQT
ncbi:hypothetical protein PACTADRAFT_50160 [Pachysolen tannophilus NRRL Y-2460]|uniref:BAH domain-containing protein n=1 Tax=Pachysolen tannophilus NRRL Y-2460 TaxID=669874 RepID=A0A1E4TUL9_PACTA|nr:hypothetical protein PACTADRAFT_50160 [Pachysolen tannophilus NRRL Y-2460]